MQFSAGKALSEAFEIFSRRFGAMLGVAVIFYVMLLGAFVALGGGMVAQMMAAMPAAGGAVPPETLAGGLGVGFVLLYLVVYAIQFAQQLAMVRACSDRHAATIGDAIVTGIKGVPTMFGVMILFAIAGVALVLVGSLVFAAVVAGTQSGAVTFILALGIIVCAFYLVARLCMINPIIAIDEVMNPITVIARSWQLTAGNVGRLLLLFLGAALAAGAIFMALFLATVGIPSAGAVPSGGGLIALGIGGFAFIMLIGMYFSALYAAIHRQLGGVSAASATVFD